MGLIGRRNRDIDEVLDEQSHSSNGQSNDDAQSSRSGGLFRARSLSTLNYTVKKTLGWKIRDTLGYLETTLGPYLKKVFPNFIAAHYAYIISSALICSIIIYPEKNIRYIDALFLSAGACTQAGLNTVDINSLTLYQQITLYVFCTLTTPIFIHGSLLFLRLYWFERHFDNIRTTSKLNFKMRRTATMNARSQSMDRTRSFQSQRGRSEGQRSMGTDNANVTENTTLTKDHSSPASKQTDDSSTSSDMNNVTDPIMYSESAADLFHHHEDSDDHGVTHISEPSSEDEQDGIAPDERRGDHEDLVHSERNGYSGDNEGPESPSNNIKFADLPKPRRQEVEPRDVYMSISMMRDNQKKHDTHDEEDGPALVINGPAEREPQIQFDLTKSKKKSRPILHTRKRSGLRRSFIFRNKDVGDLENTEDEADELEENSQNNIVRTQSHLQLPSSDQTGGSKFTKRSNTFDIPERQLKNSPTFEKVIKTIRKPSISFNRRRLSSNAIDQSDSDIDLDDASENGLRRQLSTNYLSWNPTIGRNSTFVNLSDQQKEELGGVEYRAIKLLVKIVVCYYVGFHILGFTFLVPWIIKTTRYQPPIRESQEPLTWWGFFTSMSAFNDLGYTLTPNSMISFVTSTYALLVCAFFIIIGNTGFPILLRFIIWVLFQLSKDLSLFKESLGFLLDHPRRCFTLLFPSAPTWWLFFILVVLNVIDLVLFIILDIGAAVLEGLSTGDKVLAGFFQAVSTRTAGLACVDISGLHPSVQVSYMVMMYISVLPLAISIRRTNVYEEQSLGIYMGHNENENDHDKEKATSFIGAHLRKQLSFDLWFVFMGIFIICIAEGTKIKDETMPQFDTFRCMFEVVSAYGTVGLSLGYPGSNASFSAQFDTVSKLVIVGMMIRGRHRGLPYALDRAIMLSSKNIKMRDEYQGLHAVGTGLNRTETVGSVNDPVIEFFKQAAPKVLRDRIRIPTFRRFRNSFVGHPGSVSSTDNGRLGSYSGPAERTAYEDSSVSQQNHDTSEHLGNFEMNHEAHQKDSNDYSPKTGTHEPGEDVELDDLDITGNSHV